MMPAITTSPIVEAPPIVERDWRLSRLQAAMRQDQLDVLVVYGWPWRNENVRYLGGAAVTGGASVVIVTAAGDVRAMTTTEADAFALRRAGWITDVEASLSAGPGALSTALAGVRGRVGLSPYDLVPEAFASAIAEGLAGAELIPATALVDAVRMVKSRWEHERIAEAIGIAETSWRAMLADLRPGMREFEMVAATERALKSAGAEDNFMLIAAGNSEVRGMHPPTDRPVAVGEFVRTELTPQLDGYYAQICRTAVLGEATDAQHEAYGMFVDAMEAGIAAVRAGVTAHAVAKAENDVMRERGFGEYTSTRYMRVRGHALGLHVDERPPIQEGEDTVLPAGATIVVHPNTYNPVGYIVVGDEVIVTADGSERLSRAEHDLPIAGV